MTTISINGSTYSIISYTDAGLLATDRVYVVLVPGKDLEGRAIVAIKRLRELLGTGLRLSKNIVEAMIYEHGKALVQVSFAQACMLSMCSYHGKHELWVVPPLLKGHPLGLSLSMNATEFNDLNA